MQSDKRMRKKNARARCDICNIDLVCIKKLLFLFVWLLLLLFLDQWWLVGLALKDSDVINMKSFMQQKSVLLCFCITVLV
jgi:hypothetical protein